MKKNILLIAAVLMITLTLSACEGGVNMSWEFLGDNYKVCNLNNINETIIGIIKDSATNVIASTNTNEISW